MRVFCADWTIVESTARNNRVAETRSGEVGQRINRHRRPPHTLLFLSLFQYICTYILSERITLILTLIHCIDICQLTYIILPITQMY